MIKMVIMSALLWGTMGSAAAAGYDTSRDEKNHSLVMRGAVTFKDMIAQPELGWMRDSVAAYIPHKATLQQLRASLSDIRLLVFMGTWCEDSRNLIPKLYKVLQDAGYATDQVLMYGMDRAKTSGTEIEKTYNATLLPTIIIYRNNAEIGRIIETVPTTIEAELSRLIGVGK
jgi:thiol-disulfide isomerase/thioredoxin